MMIHLSYIIGMHTIFYIIIISTNTMTTINVFNILSLSLLNMMIHTDTYMLKNGIAMKQVISL